MPPDPLESIRVAVRLAVNPSYRLDVTAALTTQLGRDGLTGAR